jgi:putative transposase
MPNQITRWKSQLLEVAVDVFGGEAKTDPAAATVDLKTLHAKIGVLTLKDDFRRGAHQGGTAERKAMIDPEHHLPIKRQAEVLGISRSAVYYKPRPVSAEDLWLMRWIETVNDARTSIGRYLAFYNFVRPHSSLKANTPDQVYFNRMSEPMAA